MTDFDFGALKDDLQAIVDRHGVRSLVVMVDADEEISTTRGATKKTLWLYPSSATKDPSLIGPALNVLDCCSHAITLALGMVDNGTKSMLNRTGLALLQQYKSRLSSAVSPAEGSQRAGAIPMEEGYIQ